MTNLTERQQQVKDLLDQGIQAREIGERLGISRNAVYQTIARLKKYGVLDESFTPTGEPSPQKRVLTELTKGLEHTPMPGLPTDTRATGTLVATLVDELARTQQELASIANRLAKLLG